MTPGRENMRIDGDPHDIIIKMWLYIATFDKVKFERPLGHMTLSDFTFEWMALSK